MGTSLYERFKKCSAYLTRMKRSDPLKRSAEKPGHILCLVIGLACGGTLVSPQTDAIVRRSSKGALSPSSVTSLSRISFPSHKFDKSAGKKNFSLFGPFPFLLINFSFSPSSWSCYWSYFLGKESKIELSPSCKSISDESNKITKTDVLRDRRIKSPTNKNAY